ncbi:hypothetical protein Tco_0895379 [Tanacetum coccineum]|uniref:Uncharacterized protein n=1 Tax=Tanacetum coccineum TaxID=301880 RepID=A0ABQ5CHB0_9ASTR
MLNFEKQIVLKQIINRREFITPWDPDVALKRNVQKRLSKEFKPLSRNINLQLNSFEKSLVKEMKDDLKYVLSLEDEFDEKFDVKNDLSKPITPHYWPNVRELAFAKPHRVIASSESRNSSKNMPKFSSNDMVHNHYLEEAKKKIQERDRNSKTSVMPSARLPTTANGSKPKPGSTNQITRNWPTYKSSCVTKTDVPKAEHSNNSISFLDFKRFICSTCQKYIFNANHDACITNLLKEVNSRGTIFILWNGPHGTRGTNVVMSKYEYVGQDTRSQDGKDLKEKDLKISELKSKSKEKAQDQRSQSMKEQVYNKDNVQDQD